MPAGLAGSLAAVAAVLGWRGGDWPAQLLRVELIEASGPGIWNNLWFAGHHTPAYGVLFPMLGALLGPHAVAVASCVLAAWCFHDLVRGRPQSLAASLLFAAGTVVNVAVGRLTFALGLAVAMAALAAARRGRIVLAAVLALATAPASPVAGVALAVALTAWWMHERRSRLAVLAVLAALPVGVAAALFPQGGEFPFRGGAVLWSLGVAAIVGLVTTERVVRRGALVYAAGCVATFAVANPLGANLTRLGMFAAAPLVVLTARRVRVPFVASALAATLWWQWSPALDGIVRAGRDPSSAVEYHLPLVDAVRARADSPVRVEVVPTLRHWEAVHVASRLPIARGWERQLDMGRNAVFYDTRLDAVAYHAWLRDNAVQFVALPDAALDPSGREEARLIRAGLPFLQLVWSDEHWRLYRVVDAAPLADGPARVVALDPERVVLDVTESAPVLVRVRWTNHWSLDRTGTVAAGRGGWTVVELDRPGRVTLRADLS
jgi:hypothetical protein